MSTATTAVKAQAWGDIADIVARKSSTPQTADGSALANKDVFMQLMVAQLKHQNPLNPSDGVEFVTQLAQFTQLEQSMGMREDLETIRNVLTGTTDSEATQP
jgi:flagellar basal-body rod modification protein FlgD